MTHYQQPMTYPSMRAATPFASPVSTDRGEDRHVAHGSMSRRLTIALVVLIQIAIVVLAIELTLGIGFESQPGPIHAPVPANGL